MKIIDPAFFFTNICFSELEIAFFSDFKLQKLIFGNVEEFGIFFRFVHMLRKANFSKKNDFFFSRFWEKSKKAGSMIFIFLVFCPKFYFQKSYI